MIVKLLSLRRFGSKKSPSCVYEILSHIIELFWNKEIFLLRANGRFYGRNVLVSEQPENSQRFLIYIFHRAEQRSLFVKRLAAVGTKCRWYAKGFIFYKGVGCRIPCGVAPCLECGS